MSDLSSPSRLRGENSNCESQSSRDTRRKRQMEKVKSRRKKKSERNSTSMAANQQDSDDSDVQLQYEERPASSLNSSYASPVSEVQVEKMRRRLQFFFMNPIEKWHAKKRWVKHQQQDPCQGHNADLHCRFPYKFVVQVIKLILVTLQLCLFAHSRYNHVNYSWDNRVTFSHLFLRGWSPEMEVSCWDESDPHR